MGFGYAIGLLRCEYGAIEEVGDVAFTWSIDG
jgi:hypothetical protein